MERSNFSSRTAEVKALITSFMAEQEKPVERRKIADYVLEHDVADKIDTDSGSPRTCHWVLKK